jgi:hypothetical protein
VFTVDALFYLGIDRGFIAGERASNRADMAYLYYLPFAMAFTSGDRLHARTVPMFLDDDQRYVPISELKPALAELDRHFDALPDDVKNEGVMSFAGFPPHDIDNAVSRLWDATMRPDWRTIAAAQEAKRQQPRDDAGDIELLAKLERIRRDGEPLGDVELSSSSEADQILITRSMPVRRGKRRMVSEDVARATSDDVVQY